MAIIDQTAAPLFSVSVRDALSRITFNDIAGATPRGFDLTSGEFFVAEVAGTGLTYALSGTDQGLAGGIVTGFGYQELFFTATGTDQVEALRISDFSIDALRFNELFIGQPGNSLADSDQVAALILDGNDLFNGSNGGDDQVGFNGNDTLFGKGGNDFLGGGRGNDQHFGGAGNDNISAGAGRDQIFGGAGNDIITGSGGRDIIDGGAGNDIILGGGSRDTIIFSTMPETSDQADRIERFRSGHDTLQLDKDVFDGLGPAGPLSADAFLIGSQARDAEDRIIYQKSLGRLFYDSDGRGGDDAVLVATLPSSRTDKGVFLTFADFDII